jgi:branched-chain amino acid transport system ATP-binding protein
MFPRLAERRSQVAGTLSGGEQQMLAIGRALWPNRRSCSSMSRHGLAPILVDSIFDTIRELHKLGTTILLVEQNARMALQLADRGYVIETGQIVLSDSAANLRDNEQVQKSYLGIA